MYSNEGIKRINQDLALAANKFPQFKLYQANDNIYCGRWCLAQKGQLYITGKLKTRSKKIYSIALAFPFNYPFDEIYSYVTDPVIERTEHRYNDGHLCLYGGHGGNIGERYEAGKTSAVSVIAWVAAWLHAYESWQKFGVWPTINK